MVEGAVGRTLCAAGFGLRGGAGGCCDDEAKVVGLRVEAWKEVFSVDCGGDDITGWDTGVC